MPYSPAHPGRPTVADLAAILAMVLLGYLGGVLLIFMVAAILIGPRDAWDGLTRREADRAG